LAESNESEDVGKEAGSTKMVNCVAVTGVAAEY
jgi:hypothetical protein